MTKFNRDEMNMLPAREAAVGSMRVIDALQDMPPEHQLVAVTATFKLMIERFGVPPQDAFTVADNVINSVTGKRAEFEAVTMYMENEL